LYVARFVSQRTKRSIAVVCCSFRQSKNKEEHNGCMLLVSSVKEQREA